MSPDMQQKLEKVRKYSASLSTAFAFAWLVIAFAGLVGLILILIANDSQRVPTVIEFGRAAYAGEEITWTVKVIVAIGWVIALLVVLKLLGHLGKLFGHYARGEIFTADNVQQIRQIGVSAFLFVCVWIYELIANALLGSLVGGTPLEEPGLAVRGWGLGVPWPLGVVFTGIMIIVVSWIMDVGRELREEQDLTV